MIAAVFDEMALLRLLLWLGMKNHAAIRRSDEWLKPITSPTLIAFQDHAKWFDFSHAGALNQEQALPLIHRSQ